MEITELLKFIDAEKVSDEELDTAINNVKMQDLNIASNLSVENAMAEINSISKRLYELHNNNKRDPMVLHRIVSLLELKTKLLGMSNVRPETQAIIDSELNIYKKRFIEILFSRVEDKTVVESITNQLASEGL